MKAAIGIDPGAHGGWTVIYDTGEVCVSPWDEKRFIESMEDLSGEGIALCCALEKVGAMPKQGLVSTWRFAENFGVIQGVLKALHIPYQLVPPQTWKKEFSLIHQDKSKSIETAQRLFPNVNFLPTERSRKPSDGMAESALICLFASRHF
jgi:crossover junction endodeoxyribonuclease RuvC